ncbi:MAG TPA: hypothetical protein VD971_12695 [Phycisphaerales bacterium]|nr:hypothetical protein [Phycisphaerales bacterium]
MPALARKTPWRMMSARNQRAAITIVAVAVGVPVVIVVSAIAYSVPTRTGAWFIIPLVVIGLPTLHLLIYRANNIAIEDAEEIKRFGFKVCTKCRYNLSNHADEGLCPECGTPYERTDLERRWREAYEMYLG